MTAFRDLHARWMQDPEYRRAYTDALGEEMIAAAVAATGGKPKTVPFSQVAAEWMKDPEFRREYERAEREFAIAFAVADARAAAGMTQAELAERMGTSRSAITRLESGRHSPTMKTLRAVATATGQPVRLEILPEPARAAE